MDRALASKR